MDRVAIALQAPEEAKGEDADGEADERHHNPDSSDDGEKQLVPYVITLRGEEVVQSTVNYNICLGTGSRLNFESLS